MKYFISYKTPDGFFGRCEIKRESPVSSMVDIEDIETDIERNRKENDMLNIGKILIMNWQRFE